MIGVPQLFPQIVQVIVSYNTGNFCGRGNSKHNGAFRKIGQNLFRGIAHGNKTKIRTVVMGVAVFQFKNFQSALIETVVRQNLMFLVTLRRQNRAKNQISLLVAEGKTM